MLSYRPQYFTAGHFKISLNRLSKILRSEWIVWLLWLGFALLTLLIIIWLPNMSLFFNIMTSGISVWAKLEFLVTSFEILETSYQPIEATLLVTIAVLQGLSLALLLTVWRKSRKQNAAGLAAGGLGTAVAVLGAGCGACGTSLLYPLLTGVGATALSFSHIFGVGLMLVGIVALLYSIHRVLMIG